MRKDTRDAVVSSEDRFRIPKQDEEFPPLVRAKRRRRRKRRVFG